jgi:peptidyl-prolyl cis-trans isomerase C
MSNTQARRFGASAIAAIAILLTPFAASAEPVSVVNGTEISSDVLDAFIAGSTRSDPSTVDATQRATLLSQLQDIYLLANKAEAADLGQEPNIKAQIELQRLSLLAQAYVQDYLLKNPVPDTELRAAYDQQVATISGEQYKARHILVETEDEAKAIIGDLDKDADFAELAKEKSTGPSGPQGGDLGWFTAESMVAPFSAAVKELDNGAYSKTPVQTQFGWHVILREDSKSVEPPAFEEVKDRIRPALEQQKFQRYLASLRQSAEIKNN